MMMKFTCNTTALTQGINSALLAVSPKSTLLALEGIMVQAGFREISLVSYNLEMGITASLEAQVEQMGQIIIPAKMFYDIIRRIESDEVTIEADDRCLVQITGGVSQFTILGMTAEEFPELPTVEYQNSFVITQERLKAMIGQTLFAVSADESRPVHTGSLFVVDDDGLTMVAVDGFRLALRREPLDRADGGAFKFVAPGSALNEVEKICEDSDEKVTIIQGKRHLLFEAGATQLICRRLEGDFLDYKNAIPRNNPIRLTVDTKTMLGSLDRVSVVISEKLKSPVRCVFENGRVLLSAKTGAGEAKDICPLDGDGNGLEIGFNNRYLMDALRYAPADSVSLELNTSISPAVIVPADGEESFLYMVLPVRLKA